MKPPGGCGHGMAIGGGAVPGIGMRFLRARPGTDERSCAGLMENHHREGGGVDGLRTAPAEETWS